jgi:hypothetical protein
MLRLAFLSLLAVSFSAQTITATRTGAVHDPQGAAVPAAALTVTSVETAQTRAATSDSEGRYSVPFLAPGTYSLSVTAKGFGKLTREGIRLEVAQVAGMNLVLPLETAQQSVEVVSDAPMLVTETSHMETTVEKN